jgi:hypothetical protein
MIRQLGSQGMVFFTFSVADLHWPELQSHGDGSTTEQDTDAKT